MSSRIMIDPEIQHGKPVVAGTRVPVVRLLAEIAGGMSLQETANCYGVTVDDVKAAVEFATRLIEEESFYSLPN